MASLSDFENMLIIEFEEAYVRDNNGGFYLTKILQSVSISLGLSITTFSSIKKMRMYTTFNISNDDCL
jgi:hypothetical protein